MEISGLGLFVLIYVVGAAITAGAIGGIRDEMDGIGDMAKIFCWPIFWVLKVIFMMFSGLYLIGQMIGGKKK